MEEVKRVKKAPHREAMQGGEEDRPPIESGAV